jgi:hypothetical protein
MQTMVLIDSIARNTLFSMLVMLPQESDSGGTSQLEKYSGYEGMNIYGSTPARQCRAVWSLNGFERAFVHEGLFAPSLLSLCNAHGFSLANATPFLMFFARSRA